MVSSSLYPVPPFDFALSAAIFSSGDPHIRAFRGDIFRQVLVVDTIPLLVEARSRGTTDKPVLLIAIQSDRRVSPDQKKAVLDRVSTIFSITDDPAPFYLAVADDPVLADLTTQLRGLKAPVTPSVFEALTDSIIEQQISLTAARSIENRLIRKTGQALQLDGEVYFGYPEPAVLAMTSASTYRACGLTVRKGEYIRDISLRIAEGKLDVEAYHAYPDTESVMQEMMQLRGIGRWTAEMTILRGLHRPDAFPADDVGIRRLISKFYPGDRKISSADARSFAERWGVWKGFAAYYLEVADILGIRPATGAMR